MMGYSKGKNMDRRSFMKLGCASMAGAKLLTEKDLLEDNSGSSGIFMCRTLYVNEYHDYMKDKTYWMVGVRYRENGEPKRMIAAVEDKINVFDAVKWIVNRLPKNQRDNEFYELPAIEYIPSG